MPLHELIGNRASYNLFGDPPPRECTHSFRILYQIRSFQGQHLILLDGIAAIMLESFAIRKGIMCGIQSKSITSCVILQDEAGQPVDTLLYSVANHPMRPIPCDMLASLRAATPCQNLGGNGCSSGPAFVTSLGERETAPLKVDIHFCGGRAIFQLSCPIALDFRNAVEA